MINESLQRHLEEKLGRHIYRSHPVSGGDINHASRLEMQDGSSYFLKYHSGSDADMFEKEKRGLALLRKHTEGILVPEVIAIGFAKGPNVGYLIMDFVDSGAPDTSFYKKFGENLARLHKVTNENFGLDHDNYIGRLPQSNRRHSTWIDFFISERLEPQIQMAVNSGQLSSSVRKNFDQLFKELPNLFPIEPPALLHGDLWSGNFMCSKRKEPVLIDPAVYFGHREMELAFTQLFGRFDNRFYESYEESYPLNPGFSKRKDVYNLYPLLVHTNLFGGSYSYQVKSYLARFI